MQKVDSITDTQPQFPLCAGSARKRTGYLPATRGDVRAVTDMPLRSVAHPVERGYESATEITSRFNGMLDQIDDIARSPSQYGLG